jgi:hypothetical protein
MKNLLTIFLMLLAITFLILAGCSNVIAVACVYTLLAIGAGFCASCIYFGVIPEK